MATLAYSYIMKTRVGGRCFQDIFTPLWNSPRCVACSAGSASPTGSNAARWLVRRCEGMAEFFESRKLRYEIHARCEKRWQIAEIVGDGREQLGGRFGRTNFEEIERAVLSKANALLAGGDVEAVRVTRDRVRADGFTTTSEIFFKESTGGKSEPPLTVGRHDGAVPVCAEPTDFYARPACKIIGTILRSFLDRQFITSLELLHFHPYIRKLNDNNYTLVQGAIHQIGSAQAKAAGEDVKSRANKLHGLIEAVETQAREALAMKDLPAIEKGDYRAFAGRIATRYQGDQCRYFTMVALARHFQGASSFLARLDFVLDNLGVEQSADSRALLDCLAADCLWDRVLRELNRGRSLSRTDEKQEWNLLMKLSDRLLANCPGERRGSVETAVKERMRRLRDAALLRD